MSDEDDCITIDSDNDDVKIVEVEELMEIEKSNKMKRVQLQTINEIDIFNNVSVSSTQFPEVEQAEFLDLCKCAVKTPEIDIGVQKIQKRYAEADPSYTASKDFLNFVQSLTPVVTEEPWSCMKEVSDTLKHHSIKKKAKNKNTETSFSVEINSKEPTSVDSRTLRHIKNLESTLVKIQSKIQKLEEMEVSFADDEEEDSAYLKVSSYKNRFCQVYEKICKLKKVSGNETTQAVRFAGTKIPAVNRAIERFYSINKEFPDFHDILKVVKIVNDRKELKLSQLQIYETAKIGFEELGKTLKLKRLYDFHNTISSYLPDEVNDPALEDQELQNRLEENRKLHGSKIDEIINKYARQQDNNHLEPEEVHSDEELSSAESGEEDIDSVTTVSEYETDDSPKVFEEITSPARPCMVYLPDVTKLPLWQKYKNVPNISNSFDEFNQPCCSKSLIPDTINHKRKTNSDLSDYSESDSEAAVSKKCRLNFVAKIVHSTPVQNFVGIREGIHDSSDVEICEEKDPLDMEEKTEDSQGNTTENQVNLVSGSNCESIAGVIDSLKCSEDFVAPAVHISTIQNKLEFIDCEIHSEVKNTNDNDPGRGIQNLDDVPTLKTNTESDIGYEKVAKSNNLRTTTNAQSDSVLQSQLNHKNSESSSTVTEDNAVKTVNVGHLVTTSENPRNGGASPSENTEDCSTSKNEDDDIIVIDNIPKKNKSVAPAPSANEVIDVDKLQSQTNTANKTSLPVDLTSFIRKIDFAEAKKTNTAASQMSLAHRYLNAPPLLNHVRIRPNVYTPSVQPRSMHCSRPLRPDRLVHVNRMRYQQPNPSLPANSCRPQIRQSLHKRTTHTNEIQYLQRNNSVFAAKRTTTTVESIVQLSSTRPQLVSRGSTHNVTRRVHTLPTNSSWSGVEKQSNATRSKPSINDVVTLD